MFYLTFVAYEQHYYYRYCQQLVRSRHGGIENGHLLVNLGLATEVETGLLNNIVSVR